MNGTFEKVPRISISLFRVGVNKIERRRSMEMVLSNQFTALSFDELEVIDGGGLFSAIAGAVGGLLTGGVTGVRIGAEVGTLVASPVKGAIIGGIVGVIGGACTGFVAGW